MAVTATISNHCKYQLWAGAIDIDSHVIKCALMGTGFTFDKDTHAAWTNVSASEITAGSGYTSGGETLTTVTISEDDTDDRGQWTCDDVTFTASGGDWDAAVAAVIWDDSSADDTVIGCIEFGQSHVVSDGQSFTIQDIIGRIT